MGQKLKSEHRAGTEAQERAQSSLREMRDTEHKAGERFLTVSPADSISFSTAARTAASSYSVSGKVMARGKEG